MRRFCTDTKVKIVFPFVGDTVGGSHLSALELIKELKTKHPEFSVTILIYKREGLFLDYLRKHSIDYALLPRFISFLPSKYIFFLVLLGPLALLTGAFMRRHQIGIVHTNDMRMHFLWSVASFFAGVKHVWHQRTPAGRQHAVFWRFAATILTISQYCKDSLPGQMSAFAEVVDNPVGFDCFPLSKFECRKMLLSELNLPADAIIVGWVANWMKRKRPEIFVHMAKLVLASTNKPVFFLMFGEARDEVKATVINLINDLGLQDNVVLVGSRSPILPWISGLDVLVATAVGEGLGRTPIEAMLVNTPVVASNDGGHKEIVEHNKTGLLIEPDKPSAFADAVLALIRNPQLGDSFARHAYCSAAKRFSPEFHADRISAIYKCLTMGHEKKIDVVL